MKPKIGMRVNLVTLVGLEEFPGRIEYVNSFGVCVVRLDGQEQLITEVIFYEEQPVTVSNSQWQICYPLQGS